MHQFIDSSFSLTNAAQESTFARFKFVKNENPTMSPEIIEAITLLRNNNLQEWLNKKTDAYQRTLIKKARALSS